MAKAMKGPNLVNEYTIRIMKEAGKFPITESLMNLKPNYEMRLDSFMQKTWDQKECTAWAAYEFHLKCPKNSEEEDGGCNLYEESEEEVKVVVKEKKKPDPNAKFKFMDP
jgi:hypothetical protein